MKATESSEALEAALGYRFRNRALLEEALTHASAGRARDNQRMEFLGDALLNLCAAILIHRERPDWEEGPMSKLRSLLVSTDALVEWGRSLGLELQQRPAKNRVSSRKALGPKPLADAVEALLAAVYLDAQGAGEDALPMVLRLVENRQLEAIRGAHAGLWEQRDAKTTLQERAASLGLPAPVYVLLGRSGPDHAPRFTVKVQVGSRGSEASGSTLKKAEAEAARTLLKSLGPSAEDPSSAAPSDV